VQYTSNSDDTGAPLNPPPGTPYTLPGRTRGTTRTIYRTDSLGTTSANATGVTITTGTKSLTIGASGTNASNAVVGEIVYFERALTDAEVTQVIAHLGTAWGI
jgi:hypothetical protein